MRFGDALSIERPHKLERKAFKAKDFYMIFQDYAKRIEKMLPIARNGNKSRILKTPFLRSFVLL